MAITRRNKKKKSKRNGGKLRGQELADMLKRVYLSGTIEECVLAVDGGKGLIEATDMTDNLVISSRGSVMGKDVSQSFGFGNLELLIKFLSSIDDDEVKLKISESYLTIQREDGRRKLDYLLTQPELIATKVYEEDDDVSVEEKMIDLTECSAELTSTFIKDFLSYVGMLKTKDTTIAVDNEQLVFTCGGQDDHQFRLVLSTDIERDDGEELEDFEVQVNGEFLSKIFNVIEFDEDDPPYIHLAEGVPVVIKDDETIWALTPLYETEEGFTEDEGD